MTLSYITISFTLYHTFMLSPHSLAQKGPIPGRSASSVYFGQFIYRAKRGRLYSTSTKKYVSLRAFVRVCDYCSITLRKANRKFPCYIYVEKFFATLQ